MNKNLYSCYAKRLLDVFVASILLVLFSPVLLLTMLLLAVANHGSVFFMQERPGRGGRIFRIIKFKTMTDRCDAAGHLLPDAMRLTRIGRFIRSTSVDELPQFINVLRGDMSLIGPRPLLVQYLPLYSSVQARRHEVRPGITGWAQVNGRNAISWGRKFELDVWYVDHVSFIVDMKILLMTVQSVVCRKGISREGEATTCLFDGTN